MLFRIDINVNFFKQMELSGEIEVHKRKKKETMKERINRQNKKTLRSESLTTDNKYLNC